jgi:hypothetical protein
MLLARGNIGTRGVAEAICCGGGAYVTAVATKGTFESCTVTCAAGTTISVTGGGAIDGPVNVICGSDDQGFIYAAKCKVAKDGDGCQNKALPCCYAKAGPVLNGDGEGLCEADAQVLQATVTAICQAR